MFKKANNIIKKFLNVFVVPDDVYDFKTANTDFESIKKDWEAILGPSENWSKYEKK